MEVRVKRRGVKPSALWNPSAAGDGGGHTVSQPDKLWSASENICNPRYEVGVHCHVG